MANIFTRIASRLKKNKAQPFLLSDYTHIHVHIEDDTFQQQKHIPPQVANSTLGYKVTRPGANGEFEDVEYDLAEFLAAEDVECYLRVANHKKLSLCFKEGWSLVGRNPQTVDYVNKRLRQISSATNISTEQLLRSTVSDLIKTSNCFWHLVRDEKKSGGKVVKGIKPVAGIFIIPSETVQVKTTNSGQITKIRQYFPDGREKKYSIRDVIHFVLDRKNGFAVGTPRALSVLDDIRSLRRIEEDIEVLVHKDLFPIYQYKVGTESRPCRVYPNGDSEVDTARAQMERMPPEGIFVTPERHDIKAIGSEGRALRIENYLKHFKQRVLAGLGLSGVDVGETEGASKSSSEVVTQSLVDEVKDIQDVFEDMFSNFVVRLLLEESTFSFDTFDPDNVVKLKFREIDQATQIAIENHNAQLFQQYAITHTELRNRMGEQPWDEEDWDDSYWRLIKEPEELIKTSGEPYSVASQALAASATSAIEPGQLSKAAAEQAKSEKSALQAKATSGQRSGANRDKPANQHGKKNEPLSRTNSRVRDSKRIHPELYEVFANARTDAVYYSSTTNNVGWYKTVLRSAQEIFKTKIDSLLRQHYINGYQSIKDEFMSFKSLQSYDIVQNYAGSKVDNIFGDLAKQSIHAYNKESIGAVFDAIEYRVSFLFRTEMARAYNYGRLIAFKEDGVQLLGIEQKAGSKCSICDKMSEESYVTAILSLHDIPPAHANCDCLIVKKTL